MDPFYIVSELTDKTHGLVAGGAIRDIVLGKIPKDYDVFFSSRDLQQTAIDRWQDMDFDEKPWPTPHRAYGGYGTTYTVFNTKYKGESVQLIYAKNITDRSSLEVVETFPFTVNHLYYDHLKGIQIAEQAKAAFHDKEIRLNEDHSTGWMMPVLIRQYLSSRAFYLGEKLGFSVPMVTIDSIFRHYSNHDYTYAVQILSPPEGEEIEDEFMNLSF